MTLRETTEIARTTASTKPARVLIADGDPLPRGVVRKALEKDALFEVVAETATAEGIVDLVREHDVQLVVLELQMPGMNGVSALAQIMREVPDVKVVVFTVLAGDDLAIGALRAGASGYVPKDDGVEAAVSGLAAVMRGEAAIPRRLVMKVIEMLRSAPDGGSGLRPVRSKLTTREWEVLDHLCAGRNTREVAEELVLSEDTVYSHVKHIMRKLQVHSRAEAVERAMQVRAQAAGA
jgi:DNA-binding NarL/FixJ family response regulator